MWTRIKKFFKSSETIFLARAQMFVGTVMVAFAAIDPNLLAGVVGVKWFPLVLIGHGMLTEYLRKRRDLELKNRD